MFFKLFLGLFLATWVAARSLPCATSDAIAPEDLPYFGNKRGNFQPTSDDVQYDRNAEEAHVATGQGQEDVAAVVDMIVPLSVSKDTSQIYIQASSSGHEPAGRPSSGEEDEVHQQISIEIDIGFTMPGMLATGGQVSNGKLAVTSINNKDGIGAGTDSYKQYNGDGTSNAGWPAKSQWVSFENMFNANKPVMFASCTQFGVPNDSGPEVGEIYDAIQQVALETKIDHRFILAVIMQESGGCVRVPTTNYGVRNPGLMQDHDGQGTCNDKGRIQTPCPKNTVFQMIREGSAGTSSGDGLAQCINQSGTSDASAFYRAARLYNSGSIDGSGDLGKGIATHCYSSDIANRLTGWVKAGHGCHLDG